MTEVVAALIERQGKILICRRPPEKARGLLWEFAGGKVEPGETKAAALVRECREELGIGISAGEEYAQVTHRYPDLSIHLTLLRAAIVSGEPQRLEHSELRWIRPQEIPEYDFCPADRDMLRQIMADSSL